MLSGRDKPLSVASGSLLDGRPSVSSEGSLLCEATYLSGLVEKGSLLINNGWPSIEGLCVDDRSSVYPSTVEVKVLTFENKFLKTGGGVTRGLSMDMNGCVVGGVAIWCSELFFENESLKRENDRLKTALRQNSKLYQSHVTELHDKLEKRNVQVKELVNTIDELKEKSEETDQRIEIQQNDLKEQQICMHEFFLSLQLPECVQTPTVGKNSKQFWVLRKHQRDLTALTKPNINAIIKASVEAGIVSRNIGRCATKKCSIPNHNCTSGFYKALLVNVSDSPHILKKFLQMMVDKFEFEPGGQLCLKMLNEVNE